MKIKLTSVYVNDQEKALRFYTEVLGVDGAKGQSASSPNLAVLCIGQSREAVNDILRHSRLAPIDLGVISKSARCCGRGDSFKPRFSAAR